MEVLFSTLFRVASSWLFFCWGFCRQLRKLGAAWILPLFSSVAGGDFEGVGEEWLPWLIFPHFVPLLHVWAARFRVFTVSFYLLRSFILLSLMFLLFGYGYPPQSCFLQTGLGFTYPLLTAQSVGFIEILLLKYCYCTWL